jgi:hypothetical protein
MQVSELVIDVSKIYKKLGDGYLCDITVVARDDGGRDFCKAMITLPYDQNVSLSSERDRLLIEARARLSDVLDAWKELGG